MKKILSIVLLTLSSIIAYAGDVPTFPGGEDALNSYLSANVKYPEIAKENGVEGIVAVAFIVTPDGNLQQLKIMKSVDPDLEKEALRVVSGMPAWIPADKDGSPIEAPAKVNIPFILE